VRLRVSASGLSAGLLGVAAALSIAACGSSSSGKLIPLADAGPLQSDFEAVAQAAETGNGNCSATEAAITTTEQNFNELPTTVDAGLRQTLRQGIDNLRSHALALCAQPLAQATVTSTTAKTTPANTTSTSTTTTTATTPTTTTPATTPTTTTTTPGSGGGTPAPGVNEETPAPGGGTGVGEGNGNNSGNGSGTPGAGAEAPAGAGTQEPGK
jgi:hypothetical protein